MSVNFGDSFSQKALSDSELEIFDFDYKIDATGFLTGEIGFLPGEEGYWTIKITKSKFKLKKIMK